MIVAFDGDTVGVDDLVNAVEAVEEACQVHKDRFPQGRPEYPGDVEPMRRNLVALGADVIGLGVSGFGQVLQATPIPAEVASIVSMFDSQPRLRQVLEAHLGHPATELGLALANALAQALAQGPLGLIADGTHRANLIGEIHAEQQIWLKREPELFGRPHDRRLVPVEVGDRPGPLRAGPIETYADRASLASLVAFGVAIAAIRDLRRAANVLLAGLPKAAGQGREAFAAQLGRALSARGAVVMDRSMLRRLDRIDTVVVDARVMVAGRAKISELVPLGDADVAELARRARRLFDPTRPGSSHRRGGWALGLLPSLGVEPPPKARSEVRRLGAGRSLVLGITRNGELVGLARATPELDPLAKSLAGRVRDADLTLVVAGSVGDIAARLGADHAVAGGRRLGAAVRGLQAEGCGVALVSAHSHTGLVAADCGIGLIVPGEHPPGGADVICGPGLDQVCFLVEAAAGARAVSRRSALFALAGSSVGSVWATVGTRWGAANRALVPVNGAALAAQAAGILSGVSLARRPPALPAEEPAWHALDAAEVVAALGSNPEGLEATEAARRRTRSVPPNGTSNLALVLVSELANPLTPILALGAALSAAVGSVTDAALVGGVVVANALVSGTQRLRTERSLQRLLRLSASTASARRDGVLVEVPTDDLVQGDVIDVGPGAVVPADCRIIATSGCEVDESSLTGESLPVRKGVAPTPTASVADRRC
ncbi:MAG TPA: cation-transporting P-type ATPase, partial [Acidimicrobiales bacterium]|nr:cation-transporting P-type ATPase [Acidimicrobiales bacterium]